MDTTTPETIMTGTSTPKTITVETTTPKATEPPWYQTSWFAWGTSSALIVLVWIPCFVLLFFSGRKLWEVLQIKRKFDKQAKRKEKILHENWDVYFRNLEQERITDPDTWAYEPLVYLSMEERGGMGFQRLKRETARMIAVDTAKSGKGSSDIERVVIFDYLREIEDEKSEKIGEANGLIRSVPGCRSEKIKIRRDSQAFLYTDRDALKRRRQQILDAYREKLKPPPPAEKPYPEDCLHMTELYDYYGYSIYLCQAPVPKQFCPHWRMIWQERIGVIVWIGALVELGKRKLDAYIEMNKGCTMLVEPFEIETVSIHRVHNDYDVYTLNVINAEDSILCGNDKPRPRTMILFHVHAWPDHKQPHDPAALANLLVQIQGRQLVAHKESVLSGLLVHCSLGVQRSPALVAAYIGRQMWMATRHVNLMGIFQYIRRRRFKAFGMGNPFSQVQIVFGVLQVIAARAAKDEVVQRPHMTAEERAVFDRKHRVAEMARQLRSREDSDRLPPPATKVTVVDEKQGGSNLKNATRRSIEGKSGSDSKDATKRSMDSGGKHSGSDPKTWTKRSTSSSSSVKRIAPKGKNQ